METLGLGKATLEDLCTTDYAKTALPADSTIPGITIDASSIQVSLVTNSSVTGVFFPTSTIDYCNITFAYSHNGLANDTVHVSYWVPAPADFQNRYLSTGGGGLAINSGAMMAPSGIIVGAVSGVTDGGFGSFDTQWDAVFLEANGTVNWQSVYMFGYQAHDELAILGKQFARNLYSVAASTKIYSYYQGCSEGGREGWSQIQRFTGEFDGVVTGAPAFRYGQQQVNHLYGNVVEQTLDYYPPVCELQKIMNMTIEACDILDGRTDGVVARSDLCLLQFNLNSTVGAPYSCPATSGSTTATPGPPSAATPAQNGTVTAQGVAVAQKFLDGLHNSKGQRAYISYQPGAGFDDAFTAFDNTTESWVLSISSLGGEWVARFLELQDATNLQTLDNVTYDTLQSWMVEGQNKYADSLQTTNPDLTNFAASGSKVLHIHGEQDNSIPTGSSVHYYESVRSVTYAGLSYNDSVSALDDWYRLFLVPGAAHCNTNSYEPNGGWPQTTLQTVIDWVESGVAPATLNSTGDISSLCKWPLRPMWSDNGATMDCVYDQTSLDTWMYDFDAYKLPLY
ncbi:Tannase/feruloyl esterase [Xylariales sp. PMI_506]|nr:Tannase/feruloyl esterase [Xylariales sp. PMI_506]